MDRQMDRHTEGQTDQTDRQLKIEIEIQTQLYLLPYWCQLRNSAVCGFCHAYFSLLHTFCTWHTVIILYLPLWLVGIKINVYKNKTSKSCETFRNLALAWPGSSTRRRSRSRTWRRYWEVSSNCFELAERKRKLLKRAPNTHRRSARKGRGGFKGRLHCCLIEMCTNWNLLELFERSSLSLTCSQVD